MPKLQDYFPRCSPPPIAEYKNYEQFPTTPQIGIEVELENITAADIVAVTKNTRWMIKDDGSLKIKGKEFICSLYAEDAEKALTDLFKNIKNPQASKRCSIHIHLNIYNLPETQIWNLLYAYLIFEKILYKYSGNRWTSNFCVPVQTFLFEKPPFNQLPNRLIKYSGIHMLANNKLSTLEFRHMKGTTYVTDIVDWIEIIIKLYNFSHIDEYYFPEVIPEMRTSSYYWKLIENIFGDSAKKLLACTETPKEDIEQSLTYTKMLMLG